MTLIALEAAAVNAPSPAPPGAAAGLFASEAAAGVAWGMTLPDPILAAAASSSEGWSYSGSLPRGFSVCFYDRQTGETVACPRDYEVETIGRGHYLFRKGAVAYSVDLEEATCSCPDFLVRRAGRAGASCKHLRLTRALARRGRH